MIGVVVVYGGGREGWAGRVPRPTSCLDCDWTHFSWYLTLAQTRHEPSYHRPPPAVTTPGNHWEAEKLEISTYFLQFFLTTPIFSEPIKYSRGKLYNVNKKNLSVAWVQMLEPMITITNCCIRPESRRFNKLKCRGSCQYVIMIVHRLVIHPLSSHRHRPLSVSALYGVIVHSQYCHSVPPSLTT